jgi:UDP-N-acetylglucosamine 2-epimerase (non-hydrolysing)
MKRDQTPNDVCSRIIAKLDRILAAEKPDLVLVQGDTTTTLAGALTAFYRKIPVGHIEAGLRSGDLKSPFPEEMNRRAVTQMAAIHFAATQDNRTNLLAEGIDAKRIVVTGNPVVDAMKQVLKGASVSQRVEKLLAETRGKKRILLTTHRRESFGETMSANLRSLKDFVQGRKDVCLIFPVHPNPNVRTVAMEILGGCPNVHLLEPLDYMDFLRIMRAAWLIVSDSGGVQEECPTLGKPLLVLRENTERPEALAAGVARLVGSEAGALTRMLTECLEDGSWIRSVSSIPNPFGDGRAAARIVRAIEGLVGDKARPTLAAVV